MALFPVSQHVQGWCGLVDPGLPEVASLSRWLEPYVTQSEPCPTLTVGWECKLCCSVVPLSWRAFPQLLQCLADFLCVFYMPVAFVNLGYFSKPKDRGVCSWSLNIIVPHYCLRCWGWGFPLLLSVCLSCLLAILSVFGCSVSPQFFFMWNCCVNRCKLVCSVKEVNSKSSSVAILDGNLLYFNQLSHPGALTSCILNVIFSSSLLVYSKAIDFYVLTLYPAALLL